MRIIGRIVGAIGFVLFAWGFLVLGSDLIDAVDAYGFKVWQHTFADMGTVWFTTHADSLQQAQAAIQRYLWPPIWDPGVQWLLLQPASAVLIVLGLIIMMIASPKKDKRRQRR